MANPTGGFGLRYVRRLDGAAFSGQQETRQIAYNNSTVIATGDIVKLLTTGYISLYAATETNAVTLGVFQGCTYRDPNLGYTTWRPIWNAVSGLSSSDVVSAFVLMPDPQAVFAIRVNGSAAVGLSSFGANADVVVGSPSALTGQSVALLDSTSINTTNTLPLRIVGFYNQIGNDNTIEDNIVEVTFNSSAQASTTGLA